MKYRMLLAALLAGASSVAIAGSEEHKGEKSTMGGAESTSYQSLDANGDGYISPEEATANPEVAAEFDQLDENGDARLDKGEFAQFETEDKEKKRMTE